MNKSLTVELRTETGKNANRRLRVQGYIPGVLYSHGKTEAIRIEEKSFYKLFKGKISESIIFDIHVADSKADTDSMAFVKDFQTEPASGALLHVDLYKVTKGEKIHTMVPLEYSGNSIGVKKGGILEVDVREIEVECLPTDLPEKLIIDITEVDLGGVLHARDIKLGNDIKLKSNPDAVIASVHIPKAAAEDKPAEAEAAEAAVDNSKVSTEKDS
jgi:large subunit ribosomal protein L25